MKVSLDVRYIPSMYCDTGTLVVTFVLSLNLNLDLYSSLDCDCLPFTIYSDCGS